MKKRILVVCGTGVATSTVVNKKLSVFLKEKGIEAEILQGKVMEVKSLSAQVNLIVATTKVTADVSVPVVNALPLLTGIGQEKVFSEILQHLS
ncbi:PTS sugar transporter subunit IIB [Fodinisporobacter ferrooxydans]|uniref:PTS sugar transporter subunit IIB n=1 Tax=Fodinisporobacter ferrooxydans TaxID=2901836 RepID=A0ABY4CIR3_9BACL|nr:PTS sugar transporter subunit IIB [Alicyclobacillaceae bacterium MYW30-H2]